MVLSLDREGVSRPPALKGWLWSEPRKRRSEALSPTVLVGARRTEDDEVAVPCTASGNHAYPRTHTRAHTHAATNMW